LAAESPDERASSWRPVAGAEILSLRAELLAHTRSFFSERGILEVETPLLSRASVTDPHIESFFSDDRDGRRFLSTSPEFHMKRLLAAGSGSIYQIAKAFRLEEAGRRHNPEFTLIEWYRIGFSADALMDEVGALLIHLLHGRRHISAAQHISYRDAFLAALALDPLLASMEECAKCAATLKLDVHGSLNRDAWLDLLLGEAVVPTFDPDALTFLHSYPASQAALARLNPGDPRVAERFELYFGTLELANGFHELADPEEQRSRFIADDAARCLNGQAKIPPDDQLLEALAHGLPDCAGVALGFDRLLMLAAGVDSIEQVIAFPWSRA
jgi:lysyl-tRNA synthetase class 2